MKSLTILNYGISIEFDNSLSELVVALATGDIIDKILNSEKPINEIIRICNEFNDKDREICDELLLAIYDVLTHKIIKCVNYRNLFKVCKENTPTNVETWIF